MRQFLTLVFTLVYLLGIAQDYKPVNLSAIKARHIGPALTSGRITDIELHPTKSNIVFVGTAGGGVWKSSDAGLNFSPVFDEHCQSIGTIAIDPVNPDGVVWVGTGETWTRNSTSVGCGIYKSDDGGDKWKLMGLENTERISSIVISKKDPNVIFVGALGALWGDSSDRGIYKTTDGGKTWKKIFYINPRTGCSDLVVDPGDENTMYASFWEYRRLPWSFSSGGPSSALYKTTDGGEHWNKISKGFPKGDLGRIAIAIAPSKPKRLYAVVEAKEKSGMYRSDDGGQHWEFLNGDFALTVRPFYFARIAVDPSDPDIVIKAGLSGAISRDGGKTFKGIGSVHSDVHDIVFNPKYSDMVYVGTDGGVYRSLDKGGSFDFVDNIPVSQFYDISIDDATPFNVYGGLQDNGSWYAPSASLSGGIDASKWTGVGYGDGFRVFKHPTKPVIYSEMQSGEGIWRYNQKYGDIKVVKPYAEAGDPKLRFNWNGAIALSPNHPDRIYIGSQFLHRSEDMGDTWQKISPDLTTNDPAKLKQDESGGLSLDNSGAENHCTIFTIAESPLDDKVIWVGTDDGNIQLTRNGGKTWKNVSQNIEGMPKFLWCYKVIASRFNASTAYAVYDGHTQNDKHPYLFKTTDYGKHWLPLATSEIKTFLRTVAEDVNNPDVLYVGSEMGLYVSLDGGNHWQRMKNKIPPVAVHAIAQDPKTGALVLGTHGRGAIIVDDIGLLQQLTSKVRQEEVHFFETDPFIMHEKSAFYSGGNDRTDFVGQNPSRSAKIAYYLKKRHVFGKMKLSIQDMEGHEIVDLTPLKAKGLNIVSWNYRMKPPKVAKGKTFVFNSLTAPRVRAGKYKVVMTKGKKTFEKVIDVRYDPTSNYTAEDRQIQYESTMKLFDIQQDLAYLVYQIDEYRTVLESLQQDSKANLQNILAKMTVLHDELVVNKGDNYVGQAEPMLREKLSRLYGDIANYFGRPTGAQLANLHKLVNEFDEAQSQWKSIRQQADKAIADTGDQRLKIKDFEAFLK